MAKERWRTGWNEWKQMIQNKSLWENWDESKNASIYPFRAATTDINTCSRTNTHTCRACWNRERAMRSLCGWAKRLWGWNPSLTHGLVHTCTLPFNLVHWQRLDEREREKQKEGNWQIDGLNKKEGHRNRARVGGQRRNGGCNWRVGGDERWRAGHFKRVIPPDLKYYQYMCLWQMA